MKRERPDDSPPPLSAEQERVLEVALSGANVFFTGSAGTGKSFTLRAVISALRHKHGAEYVHVTASTGIAATHINGTTLHSFSAAGLGRDTVDVVCKKMVKNPGARKRWREAKVLVVDEISMIASGFFELLDKIGQKQRRSEQPFGGIQLVLCGDFLQLPAVKGGDTFLFDSPAWKRAITTTIQLKTVFRQREALFIALLQSVRLGKVTDEVDALLRSRVVDFTATGDIQPTKLYSHRADVDEENARRLAELPGQSISFPAKDSGPNADTAAKSFIAPTSLALKMGAQVILIQNIDPPHLVNGSRGVVVGFDVRSHNPLVRFCNSTHEIKPNVWEAKRGDELVVKREQIPLILGWALSIHKSQGMTLDLLETDISKCWDCGQAYVALSRATSLGGLWLLGYSRQCIKADPRVIAYYESLP